jgi:hypothetical protein
MRISLSYRYKGFQNKDPEQWDLRDSGTCLKYVRFFRVTSLLVLLRCKVPYLPIVARSG